MKTSAAVLLLLLLPLYMLGCAAVGKPEKNASAANFTETREAVGGTQEERGDAATAPGSGNAGNAADATTIDYEKLAEKVIPKKGVSLRARWLDLGPRTVKGGALNLTKFEGVMSRNGRPLTPEQLAMLRNGSEGFIVINASNSNFILNVFWAFGLVNKNPVLESGEMARDKGFIPRYASTGGWPLGDRSGGELYSSVPLVKLDARQQKIVEEVTANVYRPCCNNPASFPDCNHGMAALGLAEWLAYQNASSGEIYEALLAANSYWFPLTYMETAAYFELENRSWGGANAKEILSAEYSSADGYRNTRLKLEDFPGIKIPSGGGCGV